MVHLFEDTNLCAIHAKRVTISKDFPPSSQIVEEQFHENIQILMLSRGSCTSCIPDVTVYRYRICFSPLARRCHL